MEAVRSTMQHQNTNYQPGEHVDIIDDIKVYNGLIVKCDPHKNLMLVHYSGLSNAYDQVLRCDSERVHKQWRSGMDFRLNNRLDIYDAKDKKWREAHIVEIKSNGSASTGPAIKVHYKGYGSQYDEWIDLNKEIARIKEVGLLSGAEGAAKHSIRMQQEIKEKKDEVIKALKQCMPQKQVSSSTWGVQFFPKEPVQNFDYRSIDWRLEEAKFVKELATKNMKITEVGGDGNCLFRSIAFQAYGDEELHKMIRNKCMDYIMNEREYFKDFIIGGDVTNVEAYVKKKRLNAVWGDDVEIQALSEIYNRPIEIYAYSSVPMRTFHEAVGGSKEPFRLSYHGQSHYNAIVQNDWNPQRSFIHQEPGKFEDLAIRNSIVRVQQVQQTIVQSQLTNLDPSQLAQQETQDVRETREQAQMIQRSREEFQIRAQKDMEEALRQSMTESYSRQPGSTALYKQIENQNIQQAIKESQQNMTEEEMIKLAMKESLQAQEKQNLGQINLEEAFMKTVLQMSQNDDLDTSQMSIGIKFAIENGFSLEQAIEAQSLVGDEPDLILSYLFDKMALR